MKLFMLSALTGLSLASVFDVNSGKHEIKKSTAEVNQVDGFYIFTDSKPVAPYDSLGVVTIGFMTGTQYNSMKKNLVKRARKRYPDADGLILQLKNTGVDRCIVLKFR